jgi:hypothetical protein
MSLLALWELVANHIICPAISSAYITLLLLLQSVRGVLEVAQRGNGDLEAGRDRNISPLAPWVITPRGFPPPTTGRLAIWAG